MEVVIFLRAPTEPFVSTSQWLTLGNVSGGFEGVGDVECSRMNGTGSGQPDDDH